MTPSPGHLQHPEHHIGESLAAGRMTVELNGQCLAESRGDVIRLTEDDQPVHFYFSRDDVQMQFLKPSTKKTSCPFKGTATYFSIRMQDAKVEDAVWSYEDPYEEHAALKGRLAFDVAASAALMIRSLP